jgi:hypothetical protein
LPLRLRKLGGTSRILRQTLGQDIHLGQGQIPRIGAASIHGPAKFVAIRLRRHHKP